MGCNSSKSTETENTTTKKEMDGDGDGEITLQEAEEYLQKELGISEERAKKIVARANSYKDGKVQNSEMVKIQKEVNEVKKEVLDRFIKYDKNESGNVTMDEAMLVLKEKFPDVNEDSLKCMVQRYDKDGKGTIEYKEFVYFYANVKYKKEDLKLKWGELDKNHSGTLSYHEACKLLEDECCIDEYMAKALFDRFDTDNDKKLDKKEFESLFMSLFG